MRDEVEGTAGRVVEPGIWSAGYLSITIANLAVTAVVAFGTLALVVALASIAEDLGQVALLPWVLVGYGATSAIAIVVAGPVIDAIGVRRTFRVTGIWFVVASIGAASAPSMALLIMARALQGFGSGLIFAVAFAAIGFGYPHRLRPRAFAAQSVMFGVMGFGGPVLAGAILAFGGWRTVLVIQALMTILALAVGWSRLPTTREHPARIRTDWLGVALLAGVIGFSLLAVNQIAIRWWVVGIAVAATAGLVAMYWSHSGRVESAVLAREHLTRFPLRWVHLTSGLVMLVALAVDNFLPLYVQTTRDRSVEFAALSLIFLTVGWTLGSVVYSRLLDSWRESEVILLGCRLSVPSVALAGATIALEWPLAILFAVSVFIGLAVGLVTTPGLTLLQASSELSEMGRVTAAHQLIRQLSITYGIAVASAILLLVVDHQVGDVEEVRNVIAGEDVALGTDTKNAIADGLAWIHVLTGAVALGCLMIARSLARRSRNRAPVADPASDHQPPLL